jgi:putative ABC transport system permease protein
MIKNYFKFAIRSFRRHKLFTLIHIIGLSVGISAALVIYLIVHFDFTFDKFHNNAGSIYRVVTNYTLNNDLAYTAASPGALPDAAEKQVTGIEGSAPIHTIAHMEIIVPNEQSEPAKFKEQDNIVYADERYFSMFNYQWLAGSAKTALSNKYQVVLTSNQAKLYFPNLSYEQILGKTVAYYAYDTLKVTVTGIVKTPQDNTDLTFHDFISYSTFGENKGVKHILTDWNVNAFLPWSQYFIKLSPGANTLQVEKQLNELVKRNTPPQALKSDKIYIKLQPLADVHFNTKYGRFYGNPTVSKPILYGLMVVAILLLLLACINFINLTTAQATQRAKEIGIRKTLGSNRSQLIFQFLLETFCITLLAVVVSIAFAPILLNLFSGFIPAGIRFNVLEPNLILFLLALTVAVSTIAGFYPAIILSGYKPLQVLKNQSTNNSSQTRNAILRKSLTVTQFVVAQFFVMVTLLVSKQIYYALHKDLGYKKDAIVVINTPWQNRSMQVQYFFRNKLMAIPQVKMISMGIDAPATDVEDANEMVYKDGKKEIKTNVVAKFGDQNYIKVYNLKLLQGRNLELRDTLGGILINETLAKTLQFKNPADAVGKVISFDGSVDKLPIIGIIADFYQSSLHSPVKPLTIATRGGQFSNRTFHIALNQQTASGDWQNAIMAMQKAWKEAYPAQDFDYYFFDESIAKFYKSEQQTSTLLTWATGLSILISCLGLLGLTVYTTNQRSKEIGIRKVIGASVSQIVRLLSKELISLIILAFIIATPVVWVVVNKWMQNFTDRTPLSWWIFALSGGGMLIVAMITSGFQTIQAATANPVKSLKSE